jgi:predicted nucleotidyltransferase
MKYREMMTELSKIKTYLEERQDILFAYLFGSGVNKETAANDLDILIDTDAGADRLRTQLELVKDLGQLTGFPADRIDVVFFDAEQVSPDILRNAINHGILLKNTDQELLSNRIEELSKYFLENDSALLNALRLEKERLEAFCGD